VQIRRRIHSQVPEKDAVFGVAKASWEVFRNFVGQHFWARGYFVFTVGRNEEVIREYIEAPEREAAWTR
jgi:REP element-mobilizing transposase RayT